MDCCSDTTGTMKAGANVNRVNTVPGAKANFSIEVGCEVEVTGMRDNADMNYQKGTVARHDADSNRWVVRMDLDGTGKAFKADNLRVIRPAARNTQDGG